MNRNPVEVSDAMHREAIHAIWDVVTQRWIRKKLAKLKERERHHAARPDDRRGLYLFEPAGHPLVSWLNDAERWRLGPNQQGGAVPPSVVLLSVLGRNLVAARGLPGFDELVTRLRVDSEFFGAAFEIEVAAHYVRRGFQVEFVPRRSTPTPDLKVTDNVGQVFWVECKTKNPPASNVQRGRIRDEIFQKLMRVMGAEKLNGGVFLRCISEPTFRHVNQVVYFVLSAIRDSGCGSIDSRSGELQYVRDPSGAFEVCVLKGLPADVAVPVRPIRPDYAWDFEIISGEVAGQSMRNGLHFAYRDEVSWNPVPAIVELLGAAASQLPRSGPGAIWVNIPKELWSRDMDLRAQFQDAHRAVVGFLSPGFNRRVNVVVLRTPLLVNDDRDGEVGMTYSSALAVAEHPAPRFPLVIA